MIQTEQELALMVRAAILAHKDVMIAREVASRVMDGDVSLFRGTDEYADIIPLEPPTLATAAVQRWASFFWKDIVAAIPMVSISLEPDVELSRESAAYAKQVMELAFTRACFTDGEFLTTLSQIAYSVVTWGGCPVVSDIKGGGNWFGRAVDMKNFLVSRDEKTTIEFGCVDARVLYREWQAIQERSSQSGDEMPENWQAASIERCLSGMLQTAHAYQNRNEKRWIEKLEYTTGQFLNHGRVKEAITSREGLIEVAKIRHTDLAGVVTTYVLPWSGIRYKEVGPAEVKAARTKDSKSAAFLTIDGGCFNWDGGAKGASSAYSGGDWPTLLYRGEETDEWVSLVGPPKNVPGGNLQNSKGAAFYLTKANLLRNREICDYQNKRLLAGSMVNPAGENDMKVRLKRHHGAVFASSLNLKQDQPTADWAMYAPTVAMLEGEISRVVNSMDPQLSDLSRATTAEILHRGSAIKSQRASYAAERAVSIGDWLTKSYNTLLMGLGRGKRKDERIFWSIVEKHLKIVPELAELSRAQLAKKLMAFEMDISFDDAAIDILNQRVRMAADPYTRRRLETQIRLVLGEDPAQLVKTLVAPAAMSEQVSSASVESYAIRNGQEVPVEEGQNHWNHFLTHNATVTEIAQRSPNSDPVDAHTGLLQLGNHMADHRDASIDHPYYSQYVEQMNAALKHIVAMVAQLAPEAQAEIVARAEAAKEEQDGTDSVDPETRARMERQQASWTQRAIQREEAAKTSRRMAEETHQLKLRQKADEGALKLQTKVLLANAAPQQR